MRKNTGKSLAGILEVIEDSVNIDYPELSVRALFDFDARESLRLKLLKDHKHLLDEARSREVVSELVGLGFFETLIKDDRITDIGWNGTDLWVKTSDMKKRIDHPDMNETYILKIIQRFSNYVHQEFSEKSPILNAQLENIRINAIHKTLSPVGTTMSMRHARNRLVLTRDNWEDFASPLVYELLDTVIKMGANIVISGEVGSGKTELQKLLIGSIIESQKIIMIEDTLETHLKDIYPEKDILSWIVAYGYTHSQFIKEALRNDPVYTVLSEARDHAVYEIHQSVLSGHKIILTTHAINARAVLPRMIGMAKQKYQIDESSFASEILQYYDIGIHLEKRMVGEKTLRFIQEVVVYRETGMITIYKRDYYQQEQVFKEAFFALPQCLVDRLNKHGYQTTWRVYEEDDDA